MYIQTEETPNPNSLKFVFDKQLLVEGKNEYYVKSQEVLSDFAKDILLTHGTEAIFISSDFVTITKHQDEPWEIIKPQVLQTMMEYLMNSRPIAYTEPPKKREYDSLSDIEREIVNIIEERVRPGVVMDGGDIEFIEYNQETGVVTVRMKGACSGCPSSGATLQGGVKRLLQYNIPEITDVISI